ncbi:C40 family peptidase [Streptomyces coffeae]|uniref:C40 family peptidase n=1 Tax=Streptomyces coffeae TaxID=621382 RepID=A0ABS1N6Q0_9ACTN|nr:C40 family peptidase [Streptomyces coffeae]MBL1095751.1 C40 family peptidase [Streptomyces coffeae]
MSGRIVGSVCAAAITAAAALVPPVAGATAQAAPTRPADGSVAELLTQLRTMYQKAEEATEAYNATEEKLRKQRAKTKKLNADLARTRTRLADSKAEAGRLAREQYQGHSRLSSYGFLLTLLSAHPDDAADQGRELTRAAGREATLVERLSKSERKADDLATRARTALDKQMSLASKRKKQRDKVKKRLTSIEKKLASLTARQIAEVAERERRETDEAQRKLVSSGALGTGGNNPAGAAGPSAPGRTTPDPNSTGQNSTGQGGSAAGGGGTTQKPPSSGGSPTTSATAGQRALNYALDQIGKPYVWGAEGPSSFDCSGLTSQAWAHAGRTIPRTSQEQWRQLPRVSLQRLRPGDLVIYNKGASHVAIYAGNGQVVQAPRPGQVVKLSALATNPVQGAVRPGPLKRTKR